MFSKRVIRPEILDHVSPEEARPNLADLVRINRYFGGHSVLRKTLERVAGKAGQFTLLDIGAASGDTAQLIRELHPSASVTSLDLNPTNIERALQPKVLADAFALPFADGSFDFVLCSLFLHHFTNEQVKDLLRGFHAAARKAVLVCDLERNVIPYLFLPATRRFFGWNDITVSDGMKSVRAAFRSKELLNLTAQAGFNKTQIEVYRPAFRLAMIIEKR